MAEVCVLGPVMVRNGDSPVHVGGARQRRLLATLLIHLNRPVSLAVLVDGVFGDPPPRRAEATLRTYVTRLRHVLPDGIEVIAEPPGYALRTDESAIDAIRFENELARGQQLLAHEEHGSAANVFADALRLWRGRPFEDVADQPLAAAEVRRLEEARTACREALIDALLADQRPTEAIAVVDELVATDPFNESHRLRQASTLYRAGRANDALTALREFRAQLAEELGIDPSPELDAVERAILRHDPDLGSAASPRVLHRRATRQRGIRHGSCRSAAGLGDAVCDPHLSRSTRRRPALCADLRRRRTTSRLTPAPGSRADP
jgi:DNA-binding SARP family transcriptional activator